MPFGYPGARCYAPHLPVRVEAIVWADVEGFLRDPGSALQEALRELQILTAPFDVRYGTFAGGLVNAVTRSGSNRWQGSFSGYFEDNPASGRVLEKLGFSETGRVMLSCMAAGSEIPSVRMQLRGMSGAG